MRSFVGMIFVVLFSILLQTTLLKPYRFAPDAVLAAVLAVSFLRGPVWGALTGFFAGLILDSLSGGTLGAFSVIGLTIGWIAGFFFGKVYSENLLILFLGIILASFLHFILLREWALILGSASDLPISPSLAVWLFAQGTVGLMVLLGVRKWLFPPLFRV